MTIDANTLPSHPLRVRPLGNAYLGSCGRVTGLQALPHELLVEILEYLDAESLARLGATCKLFYAFSRLEDFWKSFYIAAPWTPFVWHGSWHASYVGSPSTKMTRVDCNNVFSDVLYRPFQCAHIDLDHFTSNIPPGHEIARLSNLPAAKFDSAWSDRPFILTTTVDSWPVYRQRSTEALLARYIDTVFRAEAVEWPLRTYGAYMGDHADESPLYLFDRAFAEKMDLHIGTRENEGDYWPPPCFGEDLFAALDQQRPDCRWLIVGPERSGSTFHKDPNATSAWNAVIRGSKYWIAFPPSVSPPGVFVSRDHSEVTSPLSIAEWLLTFHAEARRHPACLEGICRAGEVLHVPSGWWHLVVNLEPSIAITQNFVPEAHLVQALLFLRDKPDQVSGFGEDVRDPYGLFVGRLQDTHPELLAGALEKLSWTKNSKKRKWEDVVESANGDAKEGSSTAGFSFGFEDLEESDS